MNTAITLSEIERHAYIAGNLDIVAVICRSEEEAEDSVSFDHQLVIDDRNRLYEALDKCVQEMKADGSNEMGHHEEYVLAIDLAEVAMNYRESQSEKTLTEKLAEIKVVNANLSRRIDELDAEFGRSLNLKKIAVHLVRGFTGKHMPKWAQALSTALKEKS